MFNKKEITSLNNAYVELKQKYYKLENLFEILEVAFVEMQEFVYKQELIINDLREKLCSIEN